MSSSVAQFPWKRQRTTILQHIIRENFNDYDFPSLPANAVRSHERKCIADLPFDQQERALFDDFLSVCRGINGPYIQCEQSENNKINWKWKQGTDNYNIERWMNDCFEMGSSLFDLLICVESLRIDSTRGPTVYAFCSLLLKYLERTVFVELRELDKLEVKNLMTLKTVCNNLNHRQLVPLHKIARDIDQNDRVGGELIDSLFDWKKMTECYYITSLLDEVISLALHRYNQTIFEWISQCSLSMDLGHEFFIWDLRKQKVVLHFDFPNQNMDEGDGFRQTFVQIPELLPEVYKPVADKLYNLGRFLFIMKQQNADIEHLSTQYTLDQNLFKDKSLGEFCEGINELYDKCSMNILNHFKKRYNILFFARHLPYFFVGLNSAWIYEFVVLLEEKGFQWSIFNSECIDNEKKLNAQLQQLMREAFRVSWLQNSPFHDRISIQLFSDPNYKQKFECSDLPPKVELNIVTKNEDKAQRLAFPSKIIFSYRRIFYHLLLLNRAKHLMYRKYFVLKGTNCHRDESATVHQFLRFLNVYIEYFCGIASAAYPNFCKKLDSVRTLDELVKVQLDYTNHLMGHMMLDTNMTPFKNIVVKLVTRFCEYAQDAIDFPTLNRDASPLVGEIKKFMLQNPGPTGLRDILFGCYFTAIGGTAADEEPIWRLLCHVDDEIAFAAAVNG